MLLLFEVFILRELALLLLCSRLEIFGKSLDFFYLWCAARDARPEFFEIFFLGEPCKDDWDDIVDKFFLTTVFSYRHFMDDYLFFLLCITLLFKFIINFFVNFSLNLSTTVCLFTLFSNYFFSFVFCLFDFSSDNFILLFIINYYLFLYYFFFLISYN